MRKFKLLLLLPFFCLTLSGYGQNQNTKFEIRHNISLNEDSQKETVEINVDKGTRSLQLAIHSKIKAGDLTIEIYNPTGEKFGNFSVGTQMTTDKTPRKEETVYGEINKSIKEPVQGIWKVSIIPKKVRGMVEIKSAQFMVE